VGHGSVLAGRYRLEDRLHTGADGAFWRAVDETLERQVGVRVISPGHPFAADVVDAARRAALVDDPRLTRILDVGESDGTTYIVTEHVQGRVFEDVLRTGPLPAETVRRLVGECAQALDRAGTRGLHHLRLSPASILVLPDGSVKLIGTAIEAAAAGVEQDNAQAASRTDAIGLVSLIYAGLTGRWPGVSDGPLGPAPRITGRAVPPGELAGGVPGDLDTLCRVTLAPGDDGPRTPGEVAGQLSPWAAAAPLTEPRGLDVGLINRPVVSGAVPEPAAPAATVAPEQPTTPGTSTTTDQDADAVDLRSAEQRSVADDELFPVRSEAHSPLAQAPAFPMPLDRGAVRNRVSDLERGEAAWPTPAPARTTVATPPGTPRDTPGSELGREILGDPAARGVRRLEPAPPPPITGPAPAVGGGGWGAGWGGGRDDERLGPFMPPVPLDRPPRSQTRLVIAVIAGLVVLGLVLALIALRGVFDASPLTPRPSTSHAVSAGPGGSPSAVVPTAPLTGEAVEIAGVKVLDPQGDRRENDAAAPRMIDGDSGTEWRSERYDSPKFGGLGKSGIGVAVDLGETSTVRQVVVEHRGTGGTLELRTAGSPDYEDSTLVSRVPMEGNKLTMTLQQPVRTRYLVLWFTSLTKQSNGEYRIRVFEVSVR